jgi:probable F420-dependent oxidoreductase
MAPHRLPLGRVGAWVPGFACRGLSECGDLAARIEELGIRTLWVGGGNRDADAFAQRAAMLAATRHLVVATGIVNIWAWDPAALHAETASIEDAYPGRLLLGLGVSHRPLVEQRGRNYDRPLAAMRAYLDALDALDALDDLDPLDDLDSAARGAVAAAVPDAPPRVLAALGTRMLELARDRTAGAHPYLVTPVHTAMARRVLGPDPLLAPELAVVVNSQPDDARRIGREYLTSYLSLPNYVDNFRRLGFAESDFAGGGSDRLVDAVVPSGDAEAVARRVNEHFDAGADHVCVQPMGAGRAIDVKGLEELLAALGQG